MDSFLMAIGTIALLLSFSFAVVGCCEGIEERKKAHHLGYADYNEQGKFYFLDKKEVCGD